MALIDHYNLYFSTHFLVMQQMKKSIATLFADCSLLQHTNITLFKADFAKKTKMQKKKEKRANATYKSAFERVLTLAQAKAARKKLLKKKKQPRQKS